MFQLIHRGSNKQINFTRENFITDEKILLLERIFEYNIRATPEPVFFPNKRIMLNTSAILVSSTILPVTSPPPLIMPEIGNMPDIPLQLYTLLENASNNFATEFTAVRPEVAVRNPPIARCYTSVQRYIKQYLQRSFVSRKS